MRELPKAYDAKIVDSKWYKFWWKGIISMPTPIQTSRHTASLSLRQMSQVCSTWGTP